ncbi:uncharacterized protein LOC133633570 isoform X1 [Entelurus aequoreus]|uniref:uncharacterized protein LOC133633570 isoform X1 n=2 Tax=Entelurus aequoreus TaxID=161455 RepID=UPI002B1DA165|nr:uncharacterized protein LOC133633570 isoform X1 [Entelurus aequoreus]
MHFGSGGQSLWIPLLIFLTLWEGLRASTSSPGLPAPKLTVHSWSKDSVVLVCRASEGQRGIFFLLYRQSSKVDSMELESPSEEVHFTVQLKKGPEPELLCCLYRNRQGLYSAYSPYLPIEHPRGVSPTSAIPSLPPPVLSVDPPGGVVNHGTMLSFSCSAPGLVQSGHKQTSFLLVRGGSGEEPQAVQGSNLESQPGVFSMGPMKQGQDGEYTCFYQVTSREEVVNSSVSNAVRIILKDELPVPTLSLQQHAQVWHMLCTGSPAYPGALFNLYLLDGQLPVSGHHVQATGHETTFPVPVQDTLVVSYQCQYSVLLGGKWSDSERSRPLAISRGLPPPSTPDVPGVDWPLILGSLSAVVLFLFSVALVAFALHKKVKAAAEEKKKRQEAKFWTQVHGKDHVVDLTVRCSSVTSQEWANGNSTSRSPLWNSLSTFSGPVH